MIKRLYYWLYRVTARPDESGEYFGGRFQGAIRSRVLETCKGASGKALEIGFGSGLFILKLAAENKGLGVWGVDRNRSFFEDVKQKAQKRNLVNVHLAAGDAKRLSFADGTFDMVICINFFVDTRFEDMAGILKEMKRVCKRSGRIIFEFRNSRNLLFVLKYRFARLYDATSPYPLYTFNPDEVDSLLKRIGLKITGREFIGFPFRRFAPIIVIEAVAA